VRNTEYIQSGDDIREIDEGRTYCEFCLRPLRETEDPDRFGNYEVFIQEDREGVQLLGFICTECVEEEERRLRESL
jgi:hypothetical protein